MDLGVFLGEGLLELERLERTKNRGPVVGIARWVRIGMEGSRDKKKHMERAKGDKGGRAWPRTVNGE